jgi:hypothetical protein
MEFQEINSHVRYAVTCLMEKDDDLLARDLSEWAIAHRLAVYLERSIGDPWHFDCEYNRQGPGFGSKEFPDGAKVRPDIIVHLRGSVRIEDNLLVIELKKDEDDADWLKACEYTAPPTGRRQFQYQYGLALTLRPKPMGWWFQNGAALGPPVRRN